MPRHLPPLLPEMIDDPKETPYDIFLALCEVTGNSPDNAPEPFKKQQLGIAKRLLLEGYSVADVRGCLAYLAHHRATSAILDLRNVRMQIGAWAFAGRPIVAPRSSSHLTAQSLFQRAQHLRGGD